jgi:protein gp37
VSTDSGINYVDSTVNPSTGCDGCELWTPKRRTCYAGLMHERRLAKCLPSLYDASFQNVRLAPGRMQKAASLRDLAGTARPDKPWLNGLPRVIFVGNMGDLWSRDVTDDYLRGEVLDQIDSKNGRRHLWLLFTKQVRRMREFTDKHGALPDNCVALASVTDQPMADKRIPDLLNVKARWRGISLEPILGDLDLSAWLLPRAPFTHATCPATWDEFTWPEWVPERVREQIVSFWGPASHRRPAEYLADVLCEKFNTFQRPPAFGERVTLRVREGEYVTGRYVHAWNNIGRVVRDDGSYEVVSFHDKCRAPLDWIIAGGMSGGALDEQMVRGCGAIFDSHDHQPHCPFCHGTGWEPTRNALHQMRRLRDQCDASRTPFFLKQWGGPKSASGGRLLDGVEHNGLPFIRVPQRAPKQRSAYAEV